MSLHCVPHFCAKEQLIIANNSGSMTGSIPRELNQLTRLRKCVQRVLDIIVRALVPNLRMLLR